MKALEFIIRYWKALLLILALALAAMGGAWLDRKLHPAPAAPVPVEGTITLTRQQLDSIVGAWQDSVKAVRRTKGVVISTLRDSLGRVISSKVDTIDLTDSLNYKGWREWTEAIKTKAAETCTLKVYVPAPAPAQPKWGLGILAEGDLGLKEGGAELEGTLLLRRKNLIFGPKAGYDYKPKQARAGGVIGLVF